MLESNLKALLVDSWYDSYLGVMILVRIREGRISKGQKIRLMSSGISYQVERVGVFTPAIQNVDHLGPGEIGFITASIKTASDCKVGDTITDDRKPCLEALPVSNHPFQWFFVDYFLLMLLNLIISEKA